VIARAARMRRAGTIRRAAFGAAWPARHFAVGKPRQTG